VILDRPQEFPGSDAEKEANWQTHNFDQFDQRCFDCDCRPWGRLAQWPCGADVPRERTEA
jgi:hypothetical protein